MATPEELNKAGMDFHKAGRYAEAVAAYEEALAGRGDYAACWVNLALAQLKRGRPDEAIRAAERAVGLAPQAGQARFQLASALSAKGRWNEAVTEYTRAADTDPAQCASFLFAGNLCMDHGLAAKAVELWKRFLSAAPADHPRRTEAEEQVRSAESGPGLISKF